MSTVADSFEDGLGFLISEPDLIAFPGDVGGPAGLVLTGFAAVGEEADPATYNDDVPQSQTELGLVAPAAGAGDGTDVTALLGELAGFSAAFAGDDSDRDLSEAFQQISEALERFGFLDPARFTSGGDSNPQAPSINTSTDGGSLTDPNAPPPTGPVVPPTPVVPNAPSGWSISPGTRTVAESTGSIVFTITRTADSAAETVYVSTASRAGYVNHGDFSSLLNMPVTFLAGQKTREITIQILNDTVAEGAETFDVLVMFAQDQFAVQPSLSASFTITDNDHLASRTDSLAVAGDETPPVVPSTDEDGLPAPGSDSFAVAGGATPPVVPPAGEDDQPASGTNSFAVGGGVTPPVIPPAGGDDQPASDTDSFAVAGGVTPPVVPPAGGDDQPASGTDSFAVAGGMTPPVIPPAGGDDQQAPGTDSFAVTGGALIPAVGEGGDAPSTSGWGEWLDAGLLLATGAFIAVGQDPAVPPVSSPAISAELFVAEWQTGDVAEVPFWEGDHLLAIPNDDFLVI